MSEWYFGTIGFSYKDWVGEFYPIDTNPRDYLPLYSKVFNCVEIDTTFHAIPKISMVQSWFSVTPEEFKFSIKTPGVITHELGLRASEGLMMEFLESVEPLGHKTGPILIQLPPRYTQEYISDMDLFLASLPNSYQYAIEFRHRSWYNELTAQVLSKYHVCWVTIDYPNLPKQFIRTSDFMYIRWIGRNGFYHRHSFEREEKTQELTSWLELIDSYQSDIPFVYGFFNNDYTGFAAGTCRRFQQMAGIQKNDQQFPYQERLF
jgi:uncharacterized protein YecE (DUF72 family)